jgi:hypothetical protein
VIEKVAVGLTNWGLCHQKCTFRDFMHSTF